MATAKKTTSKPAAKAAPKAAAKPAAKAAAKPAAKPAAKAGAKSKQNTKAVEQEVAEIIAGSTVRFLGYGEDVPDEERVLEADSEYPVVEVVNEEDGTFYVVEYDNPDFDESKPENPDTNPATLEAELLAEEIELVEGEAAQEEEEAAEEVKEEAPAARGKAKATAKPAAKTAAKAATKPAAKAAGKAAKVPAKVAQPEEAEQDADELPDLESEDADVLALVNQSEDLIESAKELEADVGATEYKLGGILYHIKKSGAFKELDAAYADKGGFMAFVVDNFNFSYRKAMNLIDIYVSFNLAGIADASQVVAAMGWSKAAKIAPLFDVEGQNPEDLIELASNSSVEELSEAIKEQSVSVGGTKGEIKKKVTIKLRYFEDQADGITNTLLEVQEKQGFKSVEEAFMFIVDEWRMNLQNEAPKAEEAPVQNPAKASAKASAKPAVRRATAKA